MEDKFSKWNNYLLIPVAITTLGSGILSIYKDTSWYIFVPLLILTAAILYFRLKLRTEIHQFELAWQVLTINILNEFGTKAHYINKSKLKALVDNAFDYNYILYGDGTISNINSKQGRITNITEESGRYFVKTNIEHPIKKGEEVEHTFTADYNNCFKSNNEYWVTTRNVPGSKISIVIITPSIRPIIDFKAYRIVGQTKKLATEQPKRILLDNKQGIEFNFEQVKFQDQYRLEWSW